jgi:hypothetical protein
MQRRRPQPRLPSHQTIQRLDTQPKPGWHRWQTPAGRVYTQEPKRYPA